MRYISNTSHSAVIFLFTMPLKDLLTFFIIFYACYVCCWFCCSYCVLGLNAFLALEWFSMHFESFQCEWSTELKLANSETVAQVSYLTSLVLWLVFNHCIVLRHLYLNFCCLNLPCWNAADIFLCFLCCPNSYWHNISPQSFLL